MFPQDPLAISKYDIKLYKNGTANWYTWQKPIGKNFAFMMCMGGGAGGSNGATSGTTGGNGGASAGISKLVIPLFALPDTLYIQVGLGGAAATDGSRSFISINQTTTAANCFLASGAVAAKTNGGAGETIATIASNCKLAAGWFFLGLAGQAGAAGGANAVGGSNTALTGTITCPGAGGGGGANAGGDITGAGEFPTLSGGTGGASPVAGGNGYMLQGGSSAFAMIGGSGGGGTATAATTGGKGGNGGPGCGGGGGGSSTSSTGGAGGTGGDGFVGIWCW